MVFLGRRVLSAMFLLAAWVGLAMSASAQEEAPDLELEVRRLVRDLNHRELEARTAAEAELLQLGPAALPHLPEINDRMPAEVKHRLERVAQKLEEGRALAAVAPTQVTLQGQQLTLKDVLQALEKQTGNRVLDSAMRFGPADEQVLVDADFQKTPFWQALDEVLDQANLGIYFYGEEQALQLANRVEGQLPHVGRVSYAGAFRFEPLEAVAVRDLVNPANNVLKLELGVSWEPRLRPIAISQSFDNLKAFDVDGKRLRINALGGEQHAEVQPGVTIVRFPVPFELPPRNVTQIARLEGELHALVPGRIETFRFEDLQAKKVEQRRGGVRVTFDELRQNNDLHEARVRIAFDAASDALASHRDWIENNACYLVDAEGEKIENLGLELTTRTESEVGYAYLFSLPNGPAGLTLVYETPAAIVDTQVKYELKGIELP